MRRRILRKAVGWSIPVGLLVGVSRVRGGEANRYRRPSRRARR